VNNFARDKLKLSFDNLIKKYPDINSIFLLNYKNGIIILDSTPDFFLDIKYLSKLTRMQPKEILGELGNPVYNILQFDNVSLITYFIKDTIVLGFISKTPAIEIYTLIDEELEILKTEIINFIK
jgi:hypothetical protein